MTVVGDPARLAAPPVAALHRGRKTAQEWQSTYARRLVLTDATVLSFAGLAALLLRFGGMREADLRGLSYYAVTAILVAPGRRRSR